MFRGKSARLGLVFVVIAGVLVALFYPTDEKRVREAADALIDAANAGPAELARALEVHASPGVRIDATELPEAVVGSDAVVEAVARAKSLEPNLRFRTEGVEVSIEGRRARVTADLITSLRPEVPELRRPRHTAALFEKQGGKFRLISAEIGAQRLDQPEARP